MFNAVGDCDDGDEGDYDVAGRKTITETGSVFATYAHDPKTAPDDPRGVLENSNLIKISIADAERNKQTPVLLAAGDGPRRTTLFTPGDPMDEPPTPDVIETNFH